MRVWLRTLAALAGVVGLIAAGQMVGVVGFVNDGSVAQAQAADPLDDDDCDDEDAVADTDYADEPERVEVDSEDVVVAEGEPIEAEGCGTPGEEQEFSAESHPVRLSDPRGPVVADATGFFRAVLPIPCDVEQGAHRLVNREPDTGKVRSTAITVSGATGPCAGQVAGADGGAGGGRDGDLPRTGAASTLPLTAAGVGLVVIGAFAVAAARRRRAAQAAQS